MPRLIDRLGEYKDQVQDQDQALLLKIMDQAAEPQVLLQTCADIDHLQIFGWRPQVVCVSSVCVGMNDVRLQT